MFKPKDDLSKKLLISIPKKLAALFDRMNLKQDHDYVCESVSWHVSKKMGWVKFTVTGFDEDFMIEWTGNYLNPKTISGSDQRFEYLTDNLDFFVSVERAIYDALEKLLPTDLISEPKTVKVG